MVVLMKRSRKIRFTKKAHLSLSTEPVQMKRLKQPQRFLSTFWKMENAGRNKFF
jgi:hypothetical protein